MFLELSKIAKKYFSRDGTKIMYFPTVAGGAQWGNFHIFVHLRNKIKILEI